jgi:hypothetical protein
MDLTTNVVVITDAIKFIEQKREQLNTSQKELEDLEQQI